MTDPKKELEEFVYIVSHDLNAPMRHIKQFGNLLFKKLGDKVSEEEREYLSFMEDAVTKAEDMIEALLTYSRLNTTAEEFSTFNCATIVENIVSGLDIDDGAIKTHNLPDEITAEQKQIRQLFEHLLDNAIKFKKPDTALEINIRAEDNSDHWQFSVQDNGIGIPEVQIDNVFTMFRSGHADEVYEGIGVGLTIAQKIVHHHGGKTWIESDKNGTNVLFTIPKS